MENPQQTMMERLAPAKLPLWVRIAGALFYLGTAMLFARLIWEQTWLTWQIGPQMIGFSLSHDYGAVLFVFPILLFVWVVIVAAQTFWTLFKKLDTSVMNHIVWTDPTNLRVKLARRIEATILPKA